MSTQLELEPGFPSWTEIGQDSGLDPLGMQRPIEVLFQGLLPGVSTITLRFRYYSFFAWLLEAYARSKGDTDPRVFNVFHRRAEVLFALVCAKSGVELGVTGIDWANKTLAGVTNGTATGDVISFAEAADPDAPVEKRYLRNKAGAFGAIYSTQMSEMGLVNLLDDEVGVPYCTTAGLPLAQAFEESVGARGGQFLRILEEGKVSLADLEDLSVFRPSNVTACGAEQAGLTDVLLGRLGEPSPANTARRETIRLVLAQAAKYERRPKTEELKWAFFDLAAEPGDNLSGEVCETWALYQACDLARLSYECLLAAALVVVRSGPGGRLPLHATVTRVGDQATAPEDLTFKQFLADAATDRTPRAVAEDMLRAQKQGDVEDMVRSSALLLAQLYRRCKTFSPDVLEWLNVGDYFQSLLSEARYYDGLLEVPANEAIAKIIKERVVKRHLWVASRKLRNKAYTFLVEPDEGTLRYRESFRVSPSSPRLDQAIQFLVDCRLLDDLGPTARGTAELEK